MWGLVLRALAWAGQVALGWAVSDVYNEGKRSDQIADVNGVPRETWMQKITRWFANSGLMAVLFVAIAAGVYLAFSFVRNIFVSKKTR